MFINDGYQPPMIELLGSRTPFQELTQRKGIEVSGQVVYNLHLGTLPDSLIARIQDPQVSTVVIELAGAAPGFEDDLNTLSSLGDQLDPDALASDLTNLTSGHPEGDYIKSLLYTLILSKKKIVIVDELKRTEGPTHFEEIQQLRQEGAQALQRRALLTPDMVVSQTASLIRESAQGETQREDTMLTQLDQRAGIIALGMSGGPKQQQILFIIGGNHQRFGEQVALKADKGNRLAGIIFKPAVSDIGAVEDLEFGPHEKLILLAKKGKLNEQTHRLLLLQHYAWSQFFSLTYPNVLPQTREVPNPLDIKPLQSRKAAGLYYRLLAELSYSLTEVDLTNMLIEFQQRPKHEVVHEIIEKRVLPGERREKDGFEHLRDLYQQLQGA